MSRNDYQLPEPWSGHLESAPIVILGSNPSINPLEVFPTASWSDDDVADFFVNRFGGGRREWVHRNRVLRHDGSHGRPREWVRFWASCRKRASELLGRAAVPGVDYAITEAVHCKSKRERIEAKRVTEAAAATCADRYLRAIVDLLPARVVVSSGAIAQSEVRRVFDLPNVPYAQREGRHFLFLDHPRSNGRMKTIATILSPSQLAEVRASLP